MVYFWIIHQFWSRLVLAVNNDLEGALREYLRLLEDEFYFEAHEVLEEAWRPLRLANASPHSLLRGLINAAIAFEHIKRNKNNFAKKAQTTISAYERHKSHCTPKMSHWLLFKEACEKIEMLKCKHYEVFEQKIE